MGHTMNDEDAFEHLTQTLAIDDKLDAELRRLAEGGWQLTPGTTPVAIYQLRRQVALVRAAGRGGIAIDDSKITIIKGNA
jgi:hypothetical protein